MRRKANQLRDRRCAGEGNRQFYSPFSRLRRMEEGGFLRSCDSANLKGRIMKNHDREEAFKRQVKSVMN